LAYSARDFDARPIEQSVGHAPSSLIVQRLQNLTPRPDPPFPPALIEFVRLFNAGEYWQSHEVLEAPWKEGRSDFYHGLILLASAFVHRERKNGRGILAQLDKAEPVLSRFRPHYLGIDMNKTLRLAEGLRATLASGLTAGEEARLELDRGLVRGDEPELDLSP